MRLKLRGTKNIFEDIAGQYANYIRLGVLLNGEKLPSCRELAIELGVNPNTVERAYSLLESDGLVITIPKKGTYVSNSGDKKNLLLEEAKKTLCEFLEAGLTYDELLEIAKSVYQKEEDAND